MKIEVEPELDRCVESIGGERLSDIVGKSPNFSNADDLFREYEVVAELKTLEENKGQDETLRIRVHELYNEFLSQGKSDVLIYGEVEINANEISDEFGREIMEMYRKPIQRVVKKANTQLKQTKQHLALDNYYGILLLVNDGHEMLSPDQVKWVLANTLRRNSYSSIDAVIFFTVNLKARHPDFDEDLLVWAEMGHPNHPKCSEAFSTKLRSAWIQHYQQLVPEVPITTYLFSDGETLSDMENIRAPTPTGNA